MNGKHTTTRSSPLPIGWLSICRERKSTTVEDVNASTPQGARRENVRRGTIVSPFRATGGGRENGVIAPDGNGAPSRLDLIVVWHAAPFE
jgi:hypothetical protein